MTLPFTDLLTRYCLLVGKLPARGGAATAVICRNCRRWTGSVANKAGIMLGQFAADVQIDGDIVSIGTVLVDAFLIDNRTVSLKCMQCGCVTRWRR